MYKFLIPAGFVALALGGFACFGAGNVPSVPEVDVSLADCDTIGEFRMAVGEEYGAKIEVISDAFWQARGAFETELRECMFDAWEGNPCDAEWYAMQDALAEAWKDVSNDTAYNNYKSAKARWDACSADFDVAHAEYSKRAREKEAVCQAAFQSSVESSIAAREAEEAKANAKKNADLASLDALEERCKQAEAERVAQLALSAGQAVEDQNDDVDGGPGNTKYQPQSTACVGVGSSEVAIPGEDATPRYGKSEETIVKDIILEIAQQVAEEVTKTPIPINAIDNKIFAGIVCVKLYSRMIELQGEEADALMGNNRALQIKLRKQIERYRRAKAVWCSIAAGNIRTDDVQIAIQQDEAESEPLCTADTDCGEAICCTSTEIGRWVCTEDGECTTEREACPDKFICAGQPAECILPPKEIEAIFYEGHLIPTSRVHTGAGLECKKKEHWHGNGGGGKDIKGVWVSDPFPDSCGYGAVGVVPVVKVLVPADFTT